MEHDFALSDSAGIEAGRPEIEAAAMPKKRRFGDGPVSGAAVMMTGRIAGFGASFVALAVVARILTPADYGLVAMVTSATAFFTVFSDFGLSLVTIQRPNLTSEQTSTLFWVNQGFGLLLGGLASCLAPLLVSFYNDSRLFSVTLVLALVFPLASLGTQHEALLKRNMKFRRLVAVRFLSTICSVVASIAAALAGWGYWALVIQPIALASSASILFWCANPWVPGPPRRCEGLGGMLRFGGALTAHGMVGYLANNLDSILIGRFWGNAALGVYSTSYNMMMRPISLAGYGIGETAIPALSRAVASGDDLRATFRRMFELTCLLGLPICLAGCLWADDIVLTLLGSQWIDAIPVLRILFLAALPRMLGVCTGWIYVATGRPGRMLSWQLYWTPTLILFFVIGLPFGAVGVAAAYALAYWIGTVPNYVYCFAGTPIRLRDVWMPMVRPLACTVFCIGLAMVVVAPLSKNGFLSGAASRLIVQLVIATAAYAAATALFIPFIHAKVLGSLRRAPAGNT